MPRGKTLAIHKVVNVKAIEELKRETADGTTKKYKLLLESETQGVKATITRDDPWDGILSGTKVDLRIETAQTTLETE